MRLFCSMSAVLLLAARVAAQASNPISPVEGEGEWVSSTSGGLPAIVQSPVPAADGGDDGGVAAVNAGTAFTYQGRLVKNGSPVGSPTGVTCDITFGLWDAATLGVEVGNSPLIDVPVSVVDGVLTVKLDFGGDAFNGQARWLEMEVTCPGDGGPTLLTPRQELSPGPIAHTLPGLRTRQNSNSPNIIGGWEGNVITLSDIAGATIAGGGTPLDPIPQVVTDSYCTIGGGGQNVCGNNNGLATDAITATIAGGAANVASAGWSSIGGGLSNTASAVFSTVGGGENNDAAGARSTVGGGRSNGATGNYSIVGGGDSNGATGNYSTVGGGLFNGATGEESTVAGGNANNATGAYSAIPGGQLNRAGGSYSFAAGRRATVRDAVATGDGDGDEGTFVWADSTDADFTSSGPNQFLIRAAGGVGIGTPSPAGALHVLTDSFTATVIESSVAFGSSDLQLKTNGGPFDYLEFAKGGPTTSGTQAGIPLANLSRINAGVGAGPLLIGVTSSNPMHFLTDNIERMRISPTGGVGIGTGDPDVALEVNGGNELTLADNTGVVMIGDQDGANLAFDTDEIQRRSNGVAADLLLNPAGGDVGIGVASASAHLHVGGTTGSAALFANDDSSLNDATVRITNPNAAAIALWADVTSSDATMVLGNDGTGSIIRAFGNHDPCCPVFRVEASGWVGINSTTAPGAPLDVERSAGTVAVFNRTGTDGRVITIADDGVDQGGIQVVAGVVSISPFTGTHYAWTDHKMEKGMLVTMSGENRHLHDRQNGEPLYGVEPSSKPNDARCLGAYLGLNESQESVSSSNPHLIMAVGNGDMWVVDTGRNIEPGDFLISSDVIGHAMLDDAQRFPVGYVIARAAERVDWSTVESGVDGRKHKDISVFFESFVRGTEQEATLAKQVDELSRRLATMEKLVAELVTRKAGE